MPVNATNDKLGWEAPNFNLLDVSGKILSLNQLYQYLKKTILGEQELDQLFLQLLEKLDYKNLPLLFQKETEILKYI